MGDRVAVLKAGWLQQVDSPQQLYDRPDNLFVAGFIGSPSMNVVEATLRKEGGRVFVEMDKGQSRLEVATEAIDRYPKVAERDGGKIAVGMRPEHYSPPDEVSPDQVWKGRKVQLVEMLGSEMLVHFHTESPPIISEDMRAAIDDDDAFAELERQAKSGGQELVARFEPSSPPKLGTLIDVGVRTENMHFFDPESGLALR